MNNSLLLRAAITSRRLFCGRTPTLSFSSQSCKPEILVVGGNGFVGGHICQAAIAAGCRVHSLSRSGHPGKKEGWVDQVNWIKGDAEQAPTGEYKEVLQRVYGVVTSVGAFGSNETMERICGDINIKVIESASEAGVKKMGFVSAHDVKYLNKFAPLRGYFGGKRRAEDSLRETFKGNGTIVQPMMVNGTRYQGGATIPLYLIGTPLNVFSSLSIVKNTLGSAPLLCDLLVPPVMASTVGQALIHDILSEEERSETRVITVDEMIK